MRERAHAQTHVSQKAFVWMGFFNWEKEELLAASNKFFAVKQCRFILFGSVDCGPNQPITFSFLNYTHKHTHTTEEMYNIHLCLYSL